MYVGYTYLQCLQLALQILVLRPENSHLSFIHKELQVDLVLYFVVGNLKIDRISRRIPKHTKKCKHKHKLQYQTVHTSSQL
jgi:uncharacterized membrane protein (UPF0127 family)